MSKDVEKNGQIDEELPIGDNKEESTAVSTNVEAPMGFEDEKAGDMIIPRVKVVQTLSPERKDKTAEEGDIINSLTLDKYNGKKFIPVFKFDNNILWRPRSEGGGIQCIARDGKCGQLSDGTNLLCAACKKNEFDNTKTGVDAIPKCTKYINFFGFFEDDMIPVIHSFAKTNYNEGKKLFSLAKVSMQNMWHFGYTLNAVKKAKNNNEWFVIDVKPAGATTADERGYAANLFKNFRDMNAIKFDLEDAGASDVEASVNTNDTEY
jgi:hypothetical protein